MKEFIGKIIQKWRAFLLPQRVKQVDTEMKQANGSTRKLQHFLSQQFEFRYNRLTGVTEYRPKETDADFHPIDEREMNGMIVDARLEADDSSVWKSPA